MFPQRLHCPILPDLALPKAFLVAMVLCALIGGKSASMYQAQNGVAQWHQIQYCLCGCARLTLLYDGKRSAVHAPSAAALKRIQEAA